LKEIKFEEIFTGLSIERIPCIKLENIQNIIQKFEKTEKLTIPISKYYY
jgi:hypothetical protein